MVKGPGLGKLLHEGMKVLAALCPPSHNQALESLVTHYLVQPPHQESCLAFPGGGELCQCQQAPPGTQKQDEQLRQPALNQDVHQEEEAPIAAYPEH